MNDGQNNKYWRRWKQVCLANRWAWVKGRLVDTAVKDAGQHHVAVWRLAGQLADQSCRAVVATDLRHACHVHSFGRDVSHTHFDNGQFDRLLLLWGDERQTRGLLISPEDIKAQVLWDDPEQAKKLSLIRSIHAAAPDEYIQAITVDIWGTPFWEDLDHAALLGLNRKLKGARPFSQPISAVA
jgi:hypothetical protein